SRIRQAPGGWSGVDAAVRLSGTLATPCTQLTMMWQRAEKALIRPRINPRTGAHPRAWRGWKDIRCRYLSTEKLLARRHGTQGHDLARQLQVRPAPQSRLEDLCVLQPPSG